MSIAIRVLQEYKALLLQQKGSYEGALKRGKMDALGRTHLTELIDKRAMQISQVNQALRELENGVQVQELY